MSCKHIPTKDESRQLIAGTEYTVHFSNGDSISGRMNATPEIVRNYFPVGDLQNIGFGSRDNIQQVTAVEIHKPAKEKAARGGEE